MTAEALNTGSAELSTVGDAPAVQLIAKNDGAMIVARSTGGADMHHFIAWNYIVESKGLEVRRWAFSKAPSPMALSCNDARRTRSMSTA